MNSHISHYSIGAVAEETGLSVHTIRAWERRYSVLAPARTGTNRRVYGEEDVIRLKLLRQAVESGHSIGLIAALPTEELRKLVRAEPRSLAESAGGGRFLDGCRRALQALDAESLDSELLRASSVLGIDRFIKDVALPLIAFIEVEWSQGRLSIAEEHLFSALLKNHLGRIRSSIQPDSRAPSAVIATPAGQNHELGAMLAAIVAAQAGWSVTYLGPNLPAQEIAFAARRTRADVVALSIVYPDADPSVESELRTLGSLLDPETRLIVGGRAAPTYADSLKAQKAIICNDLDELSDALARLREKG